MLPAYRRVLIGLTIGRLGAYPCTSLKQALDVNIELVSPLDFLPALDGWQDRSPYGSWGPLHVCHLDLRLQALAKLERGLDTDLDDVRAMLTRDLVSAEALHDGFAAMQPGLFRFPAVDGARLERRLADVVGRRPASGP